MELIILLLKLFGTFFKIGLFTIGGGYAMIPMIREEVITQGWMQLDALIDFIAIAESTPGPFAINIATYIGTVTGGQFGVGEGIIGAVFATLGVVLPSFIIILLVARFFDGFKNNKYVSSALTGIRPVVVGLIAAAGFSIAVSIFSNLDSLFDLGEVAFVLNWKALVIGAIALGFSLWKKKLHPIWMIMISAGLGILLFGILPI